VPVEVKQTTIRGAIGSYKAGYDKKGEPLTPEALVKAQKPENPNIQTIDLAALPADSDTLEIRFFAAFMPANAEPDSCNARDYRARLGRFGEAARRAGLHNELAGRYIWNLANGRALWRNGIGTDKGATVTDLDAGTSATFECEKLPLDRYPGLDAVAAAAGEGEATARALIARAGEALATGPLMRISVSARVRLYPGAEVWPSQEFSTRETKQRGDGGEIRRVLSSKPGRAADGRAIRHATMHSQKIGNAIRTVDEWHGNNEFAAVPIEAFGWVQREAAAIRRPDVNDAYRVVSQRVVHERPMVMSGVGRMAVSGWV
jgi:CRISPR-associated protein Csy3